MRVTITFAALIFGAVACGSGSQVDGTPPQAGTSTKAAPDLAAATSTACQKAIAVSKAGTADFEKDVNDLLTAALGTEEEAKRAEKAFRDKLMAWSKQLTSFADQPIETGVKEALKETATLVAKLADPNDNTPINAAMKNLSDATNKIETACA